MKRIVVGLGNPGSRYERTRHNIGWMVLDRLAERSGSVGRARARDGAASVRGRIGDTELLLIKPTTYMNLSGGAVRKVLARERAPLEDLLVVVDDMALPFGRLRLRAKGSHGGHNGLRSIIGEMGTPSFARLRVGIGAPGRDAIAHVLGDFAHAEQRHLDVILDAAADAVMLWAEEGPDRAAARWNAWLPELVGPDERNRSAEAPEQPEPRPPREPEPRPAQEPEPRPAQEPDAEGIVRTATGWRKLLPERLRRSGPDEPG